MSITHGMDIDEVRRLGQKLQTMSASIDQIRNNLDRLVGRTTWVGPTAERFKYQWWPTNRVQLLHLSDAVHGLGQSALNNAAEQERISSGGTRFGYRSKYQFRHLPPHLVRAIERERPRFDSAWLFGTSEDMVGGQPG